MSSKFYILYIIKMSFRDEKGAKRSFQKPPLYNTFIESPKTIGLKK